MTVYFGNFMKCDEPECKYFLKANFFTIHMYFTYLLLRLHQISKSRRGKWYFVTKIVLTYSIQLEKIVRVIKKKLEIGKMKIRKQKTKNGSNTNKLNV